MLSKEELRKSLAKLNMNKLEMNLYEQPRSPTTPVYDKTKMKQIEELLQEKPTIAKKKKPETKSIFSETTERKPSIFEDPSKKSLNLFSISSSKEKEKNIFTWNLMAKDKEDQSENEDELKLIDDLGFNFKTEPAVKEMKYKYENENKKLKEFNINIFKNGSSQKK